MCANINRDQSSTSRLRRDDYEMPPVVQGMTVLWSYNTGGETSPALVVGVGSRSVDLHVHVKDVKDHILKTGTRHVSDPFLVKFPQHDGGCWRHTELDRRLLVMLADYEAGLDEGSNSEEDEAFEEE